MSSCQTGLVSRLNRIEGQIRGVRAMIDDGRACEDIIVQLSAISSAVASVAREALKNHISHCVVDAVKSGDYENTLANLEKAIDSFVKLK